MSFLSVLISLLLEQLKPLPTSNQVYGGMRRWTRWAQLTLDTGSSRNAWTVWAVAVCAPAVLVMVVYGVVWAYSNVLALMLNVALLYLTLGFRQFSHHFTDIRDALDEGDEQLARQHLAQWRHVDASELPRVEILRQVLEHSVVSAHRFVFGVFFWFLLPLGPAGCVAYRVAEFVRRDWQHKTHGTGPEGMGGSPELARVAVKAFDLMDAIPVRITAMGFAIVGNFEQAVEGWRRDAVKWTTADPTLSAGDGIILAATAGALGVRLGGRDLQVGLTEQEVQMQAEPQTGHLRSVVGLIWRGMVLWMLLLALLTLARWIG